MHATDTSGLLAHAASIMKKLDEREISVATANAQAALMKQANNMLRYDLDRKKLELKMGGNGQGIEN